MKLTRALMILVAIVVLTSGGCSESDGVLTPLALHIPIEAVRGAPTTVNLGGQDYELETYLWRDFMPMSPPDGKPLIALVHVAEMNLQKIPEALRAEYLWVLNGEDVWATTFSDEPRPPTPNHKLERVARDGPKWGPHIRVDVVVGMTDGSRRLYLLKASDQWISRTD